MSSSLSFAPGAVVVAGGSGGIGAGICKRFAAAGMPVVFTYHSNEDKARSLKQEIEAAGLPRLQATLSDLVAYGEMSYSGRIPQTGPAVAEIAAVLAELRARFGLPG